MSAPSGLLLLDKPAGWTSHDVVARVRRLVGTRRVGHAGTLDPMATGVLVVGVQRATKLLTFLVGCDKSYAATIRLGQETITDDAEGEVTATADPDLVRGLTQPRVCAAVAQFTGELQQVPSAVSAIKVAGQRSYARVRSGQEVALPPRAVTVSRFTVLAVHEALVPGATVLDVDVEVDVSSGTYVRALARDLGRSLGIGGHLTALRRTRVGAFSIDACHALAELEPAREGGIPLIPLAAAARAQLPAWELTEDAVHALRHGQPVASRESPVPGPVAAFAPDGRLIAVVDESARRVRTLVVFDAAGA